MINLKIELIGIERNMYKNLGDKLCIYNIQF